MNSPPTNEFDFTEPCPVCFATCTGEIHIRFQHDSINFTLSLNYLSVSLEMSDIIDCAFERDDYSQLPAFIRAYNEGTGWDDIGDLEQPLPLTDFAKFVSSIHRQTIDTPKMSKLEISGITEFYMLAYRMNADTLYILRE